MTHFADTSAVWRLLRRQIGIPWPDRVVRGLVAVCPPVEAELMPGLRADRDYEPFFTMAARNQDEAEHHQPRVDDSGSLDDDFAAIAKVRPDLSMVRAQPETG